MMTAQPRTAVDTAAAVRGGSVRAAEVLEEYLARISEREFAEAEVVEVSTESLSPMPAGFDSLLSEAEFVDLLACLRQPPSA